jgi:hypothetical protein
MLESNEMFGNDGWMYGVAFRDEYYDYEHDESNGMFGNHGNDVWMYGVAYRDEYYDYEHDER